jgi:predicted dithiol-disulfide oxidoreductase (DUF899 family)
LATLGSVVAGTASTGGQTALTVKVSRKKYGTKKSFHNYIKGEIKMATNMIENPKIVSRDEWLTARKKLLAREKQLTRERDAVAAERRQLPWVKIEKNYVFDGPDGKVTLSDLFDGKSQLIIYHFMFGPDWKEGCPSCSFNMDHTDGALVHLAQRDVSFAAISRATYPKLAAFKKRMGWHFNWVSSNGNDFNRDYHVVFTKEELATGKVYHNFNMEAFPGTDAPGISVFYKDKEGNIFHTYSAYARGTETTMNTYNFLEYVPKGRDEEGLSFTMSWLRHHDRYDTGQLADPDKPYWPANAVPAR